MDLVVGLDSGTTATKAVAVAADATVIATSSVGYPLLVPHPGYAELDSVGLQKAAAEAVAEVATQVRQRGDRVVALCLSAAMHGLAPLDDAGAPTGPSCCGGGGITPTPSPEPPSGAVLRRWCCPGCARTGI